jgi:MSHA pilin protein MshC
MRRKLGFTLIELVLVILVISVLAVSVVPKLFTASDVEYVTHRDQTIAILRTVQQRAMQDTQSATSCYQVLFNSTQIGIPSQNADGSCASSISAASGIDDYLVIDDVTTYSVQNASGTTITAINFDRYGRPTPSAGSCATAGCQITFSSTGVCIESEGYIHVCP